MQAPGMFPEYVDIAWFQLSQTLITSIISLMFFIIFVIVFYLKKNKNEDSLLVVLTEMFIEKMNDFFNSISDKIPITAKIYVLFLFFYILWNNLFWLFIDLFATSIPFFHHYLRPVTTDIIFNAMLATIGVVYALIYGFQNHWLRFLEKYIPLKGIGIAWKKPNWWKIFIWIIIKAIDILLWLFIGLLEFIWEFTKIISLTLRLFWNIFAWMVLLILVVSATMKIIGVPFLWPLLVIVMEVFVWFLQAFVFALLVMIYFKLAEESH